jgi:DNA-directed RNA polymerase specialized sigma24 family protein
VFLGAVRGIERFDPIYTIDQFLFGIAKNRVIDHFRKHKIRLVPAEGSIARRGAAAPLWLENLPSNEDAPEPERPRSSRARMPCVVVACSRQILREFVASALGAR